MQGGRKTYIRIPPQTDDQLREIIANCCGQIALIDHNVGRVLDALGARGLSENTIVIYIADHGDWMGDHGLLLKEPIHYEGLLKVPLILRGPGVSAGGAVTAPVSTVDLLATCADPVGTAPVQPTHGQSLRPLWEGTGTRDVAMNAWEPLFARAGAGQSLRTVPSAMQKLTVDPTPGAGEMYDLAADPHELDNLWDRPADAGMQAALPGMIHARPDDMRPHQVPVGMA